MAKHRAAFTLIELLVVVAIIALLAALLLSGIGPLRQKMKALATTRTMQQVLSTMEQYGTGGIDLPSAIHTAATGTELRLAPLRKVFDTLIGTYSLDITKAKRQSDFPPNVGNRWEFHWWNKPPGPRSWPFPDTRLDYVLTFPSREISRLSPYRTFEVYGDNLDTHSHPTTDGDGINKDWLGDAIKKRRANESPLGETLDRTLEVVPDGKRPPSWYRERWPNIFETTRGAGDDLKYEQIVWPPSDWDQDEPGEVPPIWPWPWGKSMLTRQFGRAIDQRDRHDLGQLSPLATIQLLQLAGIVEADDAGAAAYRGNRGPKQPWNDAWGNPLVLVWAECMAPRYEFVADARGNPYPGARTAGAEFLELERIAHPLAGPVLKVSEHMHGGRDYLYQRAKDTYGFARAAYVAVGALGPQVRGGPLTTPWAAEEDRKKLRDFWVQIREVTAASDWTEKSFDQPPWSGTRDRRSGGERCFVSTPQILR